MRLKYSHGDAFVTMVSMSGAGSRHHEGWNRLTIADMSDMSERYGHWMSVWHMRAWEADVQGIRGSGEEEGVDQHGGPQYGTRWADHC